MFAVKVSAEELSKLTVTVLARYEAVDAWVETVQVKEEAGTNPP